MYVTAQSRLAMLGITAIAVVCLGAASIAAATGDDGSGQNDPEPAKAAAVAALQTTSAIPSATATYDIRPDANFTPYNAGDGMDAPTQAAVDQISLDYAQLELPTLTADRRAYISTHAAARRSAMDNIWDTSVLATRIAETDAALNSVADDDSYAAYSSVRIVVTSWQPATIRNLTAQVVFDGHASYAVADGTTYNDDDSQWQVNLTTQSNSSIYSWKLHDYGQVQIN